MRAKDIFFSYLKNFSSWANNQIKRARLIKENVESIIEINILD